MIASHVFTDVDNPQTVRTKGIYEQVKSAGFNPKALRRVLADRRRKPDAALQADIDLYRAALGEPGSTYRSVADRLGVSKSKLQRLVPRKNGGTAGHAKVEVISPPEAEVLPAHDASTGEIIAETQVVSAPAGGDTRTPEPSRSAEVPATPITDDDAWAAADRARIEFEAAKRRLRGVA